MNLISLFTLHNPSNLIALVVLLIPIIIHLINPNKTQLVWVASIELLRTSKIKRVFQMKLMEKLLLLIRLLLFLLLTLLLTKPIIFRDARLIDETHHYVSFDWLKNTTRLERKDTFENSHGKQLYFILEDGTNQGLLSIEQLEERFDLLSEETNGRLSNQSGYLLELIYRKELPKETHLYVTNRSSNFSNESNGHTKYFVENSLRENNSSIVTHIKKLDQSNQSEKLRIDLVYSNDSIDKENHLNSKLIEYSLETIAKSSSYPLVIQSYARSANKRDMDFDLVFVFDEDGTLPNLGNKNTEVIKVKRTDEGWSFEDKEGTVEWWREKQPLALIDLLYGLISRQEKIVDRFRIDENSIKQWLDNDSIQLEKSSSKQTLAKPLEKYLTFLFCFFLLLERWLALKRVRSND